MVDSVDKIFDSMPMVEGITAAVVFLIFMGAFKSIFAPLRLFCEIILILIFFLGINTLIY